MALRKVGLNKNSSKVAQGMYVMNNRYFLDWRIYSFNLAVVILCVQTPIY
jgi:hypothetical protein